MTRRLLIIGLAMAVLATAGCSGGNAPVDQAPAVHVLTQRVQKIAVNREISVSGNIEGNKTVRLGFLVAGKINFIAANEGAAISTGQLLASLDPESYKIAKAMADANLDQAEDEYKRLSLMHERQSLTDSDFSKISNTLKVARAQQKLQAKNLADTRLYSPMAGILLKKGVEAGEIIPAGQPLFAVSDIRRVKVNAAVPETDLHEIRLGDEARVYVSSLDKAFIGRVVEIGSVAEPTTRSFTIRIELDNPRLLIRPGMTAEIKMTAHRKSAVITVDGGAVLRDTDNTAYVYLVDENRMRPYKRKITLGRPIGSGMEVLSGLNPNELVVTGGQHKLTEGAPIIMKPQ